MLTLKGLTGAYSISRSPATAAIPSWADGPGFVSISRTADELSIICLSQRVPYDVQSDGPWACFQLLGPFDLSLSGIAARIVKPVSDAGIGLLFVTTFDTDYLMVKEDKRADAIVALTSAGITLIC